MITRISKKGQKITEDLNQDRTLFSTESENMKLSSQFESNQNAQRKSFTNCKERFTHFLSPIIQLTKPHRRLISPSVPVRTPIFPILIMDLAKSAGKVEPRVLD